MRRRSDVPQARANAAGPKSSPASSAICLCAAEILTMIVSPALFVLGQVLGAQAAPASQPSTAPAGGAAPPLLTGPAAVDVEADKLTLVKRTFDGVVESVGPEPDVVAISMLDLTAEQQARFDEIRAARLSAFDHIVRSNYGTLQDLASLQGETNPARRQEVMTRVLAAFEPYLDRGSFFHEMWPHLTDAQRRQTEVMVAEYRYERTESIKRQSGGQASRRQLAVRERVETFGQLVRESIERQVGLERENFEALANELALTAEQRNAAEAIFGPLAVKRFQNLEVTQAERAAAFREFNKLLSVGQKQKVLGILLRQHQRSPATTGPSSQPSSQPAASQSPGGS
jgi:hypothetical protein